MKLADGSHLTYCSSIHAHETWEDLRRVLEGPVRAVKQTVSPTRPFGLGLRISRGCLNALARPDARLELSRLLAENGLYVFTLNGFPYGDFHGRRVKEAVYRPDWAHPDRLAYSDQLADLLADLMADTDGVEGSVSTVPLGRAGQVDREQAANLLARHVAHLVRLRENRGQTIALALEPEPGCELETAADAVEFMQSHLLARHVMRLMSDLTGLAGGEAEEAVRRHLGLCLDLCHAAVSFEDVDGAVVRLREAGIPIVKMQVTAGLRAVGTPPTLRDLLRPFIDGVYLHQVCEAGPQGLRTFGDLPEAIRQLPAAGEEREWRVHYHVPVFEAAYGALASTQEFAAAVLRRQSRDPLTAHLEVETYTWRTLPAECRHLDEVGVICRELDWVRECLADDAGRRS